MIDGDTVKWRGERVRLVGFDTPEIFSPRCAVEKRWGLRAKSELARLIAAAGAAELIVSPRRDRHGRLLASLRLDGVDAAVTMVHAGLAVIYDGGRRRDWCS